MNCHDTRSLLGPYLDSELDVQASQGIRDHLASCPECAALFAAEERFQRRLQAALQVGDRTPSLWHSIARRIASADTPEGFLEPGQAGWATLRWWLWPSPRFHAGLAAVWLGLVILHLSGPEPAPVGTVASAAGHDLLSAPVAVRTALAEQRRWLSELLDSQSPTPSSPKSSAPPSSSEGPNQARSA